MDTEGKTAVVTGAAGGIGFAIAQRLLEHGARVVLTDLDEERLNAAVAHLVRHGEDRVAGRPADAASESDLGDLITWAERWAGPIDLFVANAGVAMGRGLDATEAEWSISLEVNVLAQVRAARLLTPRWVERGSGYFLCTASAAGLLTQIGSPAYAVSKHASVAFAEWLAVTYGPSGVAVSCLCPMGVRTDMFTRGAESDDEVARSAAQAVAASGDVLEPLQVADAVIAGIRAEKFLILPHPEVLTYLRHKASDHDRWIAGMQRHHASLGRETN